VEAAVVVRGLGCRGVLRSQSAAATARIAFATTRVLFLDDNVVNVAAGRAAGWTAIHVRGPAEARAALVGVGLLTG
jgi:hypothetical protein